MNKMVKLILQPSMGDQILNDWRKTCDELAEISEKMIKSKWYRIFEQERLVQEYKIANERWLLLFDYCVKFNLFNK